MDKMISLEQLFQSYQNLPEGEVILDVRSPEEWAQIHIPGSLNIPHDEVENHIDELKKYQKIFIHCRSGGRAQRAFATLKGKGLTNLYCLGDTGIMAWMDEGYPIEADE